MDAVVWLNVILGIIWATMFVYLNGLRKRLWISRINLHADYLYVANRIYTLHAIWGKIAGIVMMCKKYNLSPEDEKNISVLFREVADIMEGEVNGSREESLCESRGNQV